MKTLPLLLLGLTILACTFRPVLASKLSVQFEDGTAYVTVKSSIQQNFTFLEEHVVDLDGRDLDLAREALERALTARSNDVSVSDLALKLVTKKTQLNVTISFNVENISSVSGQIVRTDCTWRSFSVPDDLLSRNVSYNLVGKTYVRPVVLSFANNTWARFYINETYQVFYQEAANIAGNATLLDFRPLSRSLALWNQTLDLENQKTIWIFPPEKALDLTVALQEPNGTRTYYSTIEVSSEIAGPSFVRVDGDIIVSTQRSSAEQNMFAAAIVTVILALSIFVYDRKRKKPIKPRR